MLGVEPRASYMQSKRSPAELHPLCVGTGGGLGNSLNPPPLPHCPPLTLLCPHGPHPRNRPPGLTLMVAPALLCSAQCCLQLPFPTPSSICLHLPPCPPTHQHLAAGSWVSMLPMGTWGTDPTGPGTAAIIVPWLCHGPTRLWGRWVPKRRARPGVQPASSHLFTLSENHTP